MGDLRPEAAASGLGVMGGEAVVLAVTAVVPPTTIAALLAVLAVSQPRRLLISYLSAGMPFGIWLGALVVPVLGGLVVPGGCRVADRS